MRVLHGVAHARDELEALAGGELAPARVVSELFPVDELHREEGLRAGARVGGAGLVDLRDARVLEEAEDLGLALEPLRRIGVATPGFRILSATRRRGFSCSAS
jgi:hypothetical protein